MPFSQIARPILIGVILASTLPAQVNVLTANYGNDRTNTTLQEQILTPSKVAPASFGRIGSFPVDGQIYAQPLYVQGVTIGEVKRNVVFVATLRNTVYAIDADAPASETPLWSVNLGSPVPSAFMDLTDPRPDVGILSTPVIDLARNVIYVVADTFVDEKAVYRLHALSLSDGQEMCDGPVEIKAVVDGGGDASEDGKIVFDPKQHLQRPGLLLANDTVYIAFGSHDDLYPHHGWVMGYDASSIQRQTALFNTTPQGGAGSIWQAGRGLAADSAGNLYVASGNGDYDGVSNFGESFIKLGPDLTVLDWFTPKNWNELSEGDYDLAGLGPMLTPGTEQFVGGDKAGNMYLVDRNNLGHLGVDGANYPQIFQPVAYGGVFTAALWESARGLMVYVAEAGDYTMAFRSVAGWFETTPFSMTSVNPDLAYHGMAVSANGVYAETGILWMTTGDHSVRGPVAGTLHAFDALDLTNELWNSDMVGDRDKLGIFTRFVAPTVANGRVYVATQSKQLAIYGLIEAPPPIERSSPSRPHDQTDTGNPTNPSDTPTATGNEPPAETRNCARVTSLPRAAQARPGDRRC